MIALLSNEIISRMTYRYEDVGRLGGNHTCCDLEWRSYCAGAGAGSHPFAQGSLLFTAADINKDGTVTLNELKTTIEKWFADAEVARSGSITQDDLIPGLNAVRDLISRQPEGSLARN
jgi:hypothetical protein